VPRPCVMVAELRAAAVANVIRRSTDIIESRLASPSYPHTGHLFIGRVLSARSNRQPLRVAGFLSRGTIVGKVPPKVVFDSAEPDDDDDEP
jgi:hypothetical protein